jgi:hypothetical protein
VVHVFVLWWSVVTRLVVMLDRWHWTDYIDERKRAEGVPMTIMGGELVLPNNHIPGPSVTDDVFGILVPDDEDVVRKADGTTGIQAASA